MATLVARRVVAALLLIALVFGAMLMSIVHPVGAAPAACNEATATSAACHQGLPGQATMVCSVACAAMLAVLLVPRVGDAATEAAQLMIRSAPDLGRTLSPEPPPPKHRLA